MAKKKTVKKKATLACPHCGHSISAELLQEQYSRRGRQRRFRILCPITECARIIQVETKLTPAFTISKAKGSA